MAKLRELLRNIFWMELPAPEDALVVDDDGPPYRTPAEEQESKYVFDWPVVLVPLGLLVLVVLVGGALFTTCQQEYKQQVSKVCLEDIGDGLMQGTITNRGGEQFQRRSLNCSAEMASCVWFSKEGVTNPEGSFSKTLNRAVKMKKWHPDHECFEFQ